MMMYLGHKTPRVILWSQVFNFGKKTVKKPVGLLRDELVAYGINNKKYVLPNFFSIELNQDAITLKQGLDMIHDASTEDLLAATHKSIVKLTLSQGKPAPSQKRLFKEWCAILGNCCDQLTFDDSLHTIKTLDKVGVNLDPLAKQKIALQKETFDYAATSKLIPKLYERVLTVFEQTECPHERHRMMLGIFG